MPKFGFSGGQPIVGTMVTMPSRVKNLEAVLSRIVGQVDHFYLFLDNFGNVPLPQSIQQDPRINVLKAEEMGNLRGDAAFLASRFHPGDHIVLKFDDDILYPANYCRVLVGELARSRGSVIIGVHGRIFVPPHRSYVSDALCFHFADQLAKTCHVHELGSGTSAFHSRAMRFDPGAWEYVNMADINIAIEAQRRGIPRIAVARPANWLRPLEQDQANSLWLQAKKDDRVQSSLMRKILADYSDIQSSPRKIQRRSAG